MGNEDKYSTRGLRAKMSFQMRFISLVVTRKPPRWDHVAGGIGLIGINATTRQRIRAMLLHLTSPRCTRNFFLPQLLHH